jgi:hypothetical protein
LAVKFETLLRRLRKERVAFTWDEGGAPALLIPPEVMEELRGDLEEHREMFRLVAARSVMMARLTATEVPAAWWRSPRHYSQAHLLRADAYRGEDLIAWCGRPLPTEWHLTWARSGRCATCRRLAKANDPPWFDEDREIQG